MTDLNEIAGHQKVAAFLLSLEPDTAKNILRHLKGDVVEKVAQSMVDFDPRLSEAGTVDELYRQLALSVHGPKTVKGVNHNELAAFLEAVPPPR